VSQQTKPNVILVMTDQQGAWTLPSYGNTIAKTPTFDRLAAESIQWDWCFVQQPVCVPSRISIHTGRYPAAHRSRGNNAFVGTDESTLPHILREQGYTIALTGKNHCIRPDDLATWDYVYEVDHLGPRDPTDEARLRHVEDARAEVYYKRAVSYATLPFPKEEFGTYLIRDAADAFLRRQHDKPFFLWLSFPDPHPPYTIPEELGDRYDAESIPLPPKEPKDFADKPPRYRFMSRMMETHRASDREMRELIATYYTMISMVDDALASLMQTLEETGLDQETLVIFISDHGDFVGHHNMVEKGPSLFDSLVHVPLYFRFPGRLAPRRVSDTLIESIDVMPTILDLLGIDIPRGVQGISALPCMTGERAMHRAAVFSQSGTRGVPIAADEVDRAVAFRQEEYRKDPGCRRFPWITPERAGGRMFMVRTLDWKYVHHVGASGELYDLTSDPGELVNRFDDPACSPVLAEMRSQLIDLMAQTEDPRLPAGFDPGLHRLGRVRP